MNRTFISSPYSGEIERNVKYARECLHHSFELGEAPFASHLLYTQPGILNDGIAKERERGLQAAFEWLSSSDYVAFYTDYGWSEGMIKELKICRLYRHNIDLRTLYGKPPNASQEVNNLLSYWNLKQGA